MYLLFDLLYNFKTFSSDREARKKFAFRFLFLVYFFSWQNRYDKQKSNGLEIYIDLNPISGYSIENQNITVNFFSLRKYGIIIWFLILICKTFVFSLIFEENCCPNRQFTMQVLGFFRYCLITTKTDAAT